MVFDLFGLDRRRQRPSKGEKELLSTKQKERCNYCGKRRLAHLEVDRKNPLAKGGSDRITNKQLLCGPCNKRKGSLSDGEFRRRYRLTSVRQASGPPTKTIPHSYFEEISKSVGKKENQGT